jgi:hypothetical protein
MGRGEIGIVLKFIIVSLALIAVQSCSDTMAVAPESGETKTGEKMTQAVAVANIVTGVLSSDGVMCPAMQGDDGELYTFETLPKGLKPGDKIKVTKSDNKNPMSFCDQGRVLRWSKITRMSPDNTIEKTWTFED